MQIIELHGDENITIIRQLVEAATEQDVLLYVPRGCEALERNRVNLAVLRRWADNLLLRLGVVLEDRETRGLAKEVGLLVLPSVRYARDMDWERLDRSRRRRQGLPPRPLSHVMAPRTVDTGIRSRGRRSLPGAVAGLVAALVALATLAGVFIFLLPSATVTLYPASEPAEGAMEIVGVAGLEEVDYGSGEIPARTLSVERTLTETIATTDRRDVPDGYAQGTVVFANKTTIPATIPKGTLVRTSTGDTVRFFTLADAELPGALYATVRVGVLAAEAGPRGNVSALSINVIEGTLAAQADVLNDARLSGGTVRRMGVVALQDRSTLHARALQSAQEASYRELTSSLSATEFVPPDSLVVSVVEEIFDYGVGDAADELTVRLRVQVTGLAVDTVPGQVLLVRLLEQQVKPGYALVEGSATFTRDSLISATPETARFAMSVRAALVPSVNTDRLRRAIAGRSLTAAREYLAGQFVQRAEAQIQLSTPLLQRLPWWAERIRVLVSAG